jgi:hypothetical protein
MAGMTDPRLEFGEESMRSSEIQPPGPLRVGGDPIGDIPEGAGNPAFIVETS